MTVHLKIDVIQLLGMTQQTQPVANCIARLHKWDVGAINMVHVQSGGGNPDFILYLY